MEPPPPPSLSSRSTSPSTSRSLRAWSTIPIAERNPNPSPSLAPASTTRSWHIPPPPDNVPTMTTTTRDVLQRQRNDDQNHIRSIHIAFRGIFSELIPDARKLEDVKGRVDELKAWDREKRQRRNGAQEDSEEEGNVGAMMDVDNETGKEEETPQPEASKTPARKRKRPSRSPEPARVPPKKRQSKLAVGKNELRYLLDMERELIDRQPAKPKVPAETSTTARPRRSVVPPPTTVTKKPNPRVAHSRGGKAEKYGAYQPGEVALYINHVPELWRRGWRKKRFVVNVEDVLDIDQLALRCRKAGDLVGTWKEGGLKGQVCLRRNLERGRRERWRGVVEVD